MHKILEKLFTAAHNHGNDSGEPDHTVGDLQDLLRRAWYNMSVSQKLQLLNSDEVEQVATLGSQGAFEPEDLVAEITEELAKMESAVMTSGYSFMENEGGFYWETESEGSEDFYAREDAIADAYRHLMANKATPQ